MKLPISSQQYSQPFLYIQKPDKGKLQVLLPLFFPFYSAKLTSHNSFITATNVMRRFDDTKRKTNNITQTRTTHFDLDLYIQQIVSINSTFATHLDPLLLHPSYHTKICYKMCHFSHPGLFVMWDGFHGLCHSRDAAVAAISAETIKPFNPHSSRFVAKLHPYTSTPHSWGWRWRCW